MLNLDEALKQTVERVKRDRNEDDKIYLNVSDLVGIAIRQHARETNRLEELNKQKNIALKAKDERIAEIEAEVAEYKQEAEKIPNVCKLECGICFPNPTCPQICPKFKKEEGE